MIDFWLFILYTLISWDTNLTLWVNGMYMDYWDNFMELFSGRFIWIPFYVSVAYVIFKHYHWKAALTCIAVAVLLLVLNDQLSSSVIRHLVGRMRPSNLDNPTSSMIHVVDNYRGGRFGFPSAHATNSWGFTFFIIYVFRRRLLSITMVSWGVMICYSRLYLGVHYLGDVTAGMLLGLLNATLVYFLFKRFQPKTVAVFKPDQAGAASFFLPVLVCWATTAIMLVLAFFVDP